MSDRLYLKNDRVIILDGPFGNGLTYGSAGILVDRTDNPDMFRVRIQCGPTNWIGEVVSVHRSQLVGIGEAMKAVHEARKAEWLRESQEAAYKASLEPNTSVISEEKCRCEPKPVKNQPHSPACRYQNRKDQNVAVS